jgi:hypothetical protein
MSNASEQVSGTSEHIRREVRRQERLRQEAADGPRTVAGVCTQTPVNSQPRILTDAPPWGGRG